MSGSGSGLDGYLVVDKPAGWTSHDVVARARRLLGERRVGHGGTLDPDATGVLVLAAGRATRLLRFLGELTKSYEGEIVLGTATTTLDAAGAVTATYDMSGVTLEQARAAAAGLTGRLEQVPPMVSAVQVGGRRLHELAREGKEIERAPRPVEVHRFKLEQGGEPGVLRAQVTCSSGTYVRSLAADLGVALGGGAHLRALRRLAVGPFELRHALELEQVGPERLGPPAGLVAHLVAIAVPDELAAVVAHGKVLERRLLGTTGPGPWALLDGEGALLAVYEARGQDRAKPAVVLLEQAPAEPAAGRASAPERPASAPGPTGATPRSRRTCVVTAGTFDGVHLGHRRLLAEGRRAAAAQGLPLVAVTFDRHPASVLHPSAAPRLLTGLPHKVELLERSGADEVVVLSFDPAQAGRPAEAFVVETLVELLGAATVVVGENFRFGNRGLGTYSLLEQLGPRHGFEARAVALLPSAFGAPVSSSLLRDLVALGRLEQAAELLARPHEVRGERPAGSREVRLAPELALPPAGRYRALAAPLGEPLRPCAAALVPSAGEPAAGQPPALTLLLDPEPPGSVGAPASIWAVAFPSGPLPGGPPGPEG